MCARLIQQLEILVRKLDVLEEARSSIPHGSTWRIKEDGEGGTATMTPLDEFGRPMMQLTAAAADKNFAGPGLVLPEGNPLDQPYQPKVSARQQALLRCALLHYF